MNKALNAGPNCEVACRLVEHLADFDSASDPGDAFGVERPGHGVLRSCRSVADAITVDGACLLSDDSVRRFGFTAAA
jgi:hypothetical protein